MELFGWTISYLPTFGGAAIALLCILMLAIFGASNKFSFGLLFGWMYEEMYNFFGDILGERELAWIKSFVTNMFFVILLYNLLGLLFDFISPIFGYDAETGEFLVSNILGFATSDYHFTIGMAIVGVLIVLGVQLVSMSGSTFLGKEISQAKWNTPLFKLSNFVYEYIPFWGKGIITLEKGSVPNWAFYPLWVLIKAFDILISLFVGFLDIIGIFAKVISLAFRLFGNMLSGTALLTVLIVGLSATTSSRFGTELPLIAPLILFLQGLLVACIQAFVFPLLIAIFIKVARMADEDEAATT